MLSQVPKFANLLNGNYNARMDFSLRQTEDGSQTLYSTAYQETFHSKFGALTETEHIFLRGTGVAPPFSTEVEHLHFFRSRLLGPG